MKGRFLLVVLFLLPLLGKSQGLSEKHVKPLWLSEKQSSPIWTDTLVSPITGYTIDYPAYQWRSQPENQVDSIYRNVWDMETPAYYEQSINYGRYQRPVMPVDK